MTDTVAPDTPALGLFARAIGIITSPKATFEKVIAAPRPVGILFLCAILAGGSMAAFALTEKGRQAQVGFIIDGSDPAVATPAFASMGGWNAWWTGSAAPTVPPLHALLDKALVEMDPKARAEIMNTFQQKAFDTWMPIFALYVEPKKAILQPNLGGYDKMVGPWSQGLQYHTQGEFFLA